MATMTTDDLRRILTDVAGDTGDGVLTGDIDDTAFDALGYDSLALLEAAARIARDYDVHIPDDLLFELHTPRQLLDVVNGAVPEAH